MSSREFCNIKGNEHATVFPSVEVRDSLGTLAVQVLASREDLSTMDYPQMLRKLYDIVCELHDAFKHEHFEL